MLESLKKLSKGKKIGIGAGGAALIALIAALCVWQPWQQREAPPDGGQGQTQTPPADSGGGDEEEPVTLRVGNEDIPCTIYEENGWKLYIPTDWTREDDGAVTVRFVSPEGAGLYVSRTHQGEDTLADTYASIYPGEDTMNREFYTGDGQNAWHLTFSAPADRWEDFDHLFRAIARTGELDGKKPFEAWTPMPEEPDWQNIDGETFLFSDKDGALISDAAEEAVRARMLDWPDEQKTAFTGKYDCTLDWLGSYVHLGEDTFVNVFGSKVAYEIKAGQEGNVVLSGGQDIENGWLKEEGTLYLIVTQNGGPVEKKLTMWSNDCAPGDPIFASDVTNVLAG